MKKILFYTSGVGLGGVEKVILEVLKAIDKNKFDIKLGLQYENENLFESEIPREIEYKYMLPQKVINKSLYYRSKKKNIFYKLMYSFMLRYEKYIIRKNYLEFSKDREIVIDFKSGDFLKLINLNKDIKKICWLHGEITKLNRYEERKNKLRNQLKKCNKIICICNEMKENIIKEMPKIEDKLEMIYNPFDIEKIKKLSENILELSEKEKKLLKDKYIIMVSRLDNHQKDIITLIKSFSLFCEKNTNFKLYLLGEGPDRKTIEEKIKELNLEDKILLLGVKKNPYPWIKNAELLIHSSKYEGLPTVLIEALILKKMIISTNCPTGPKEILGNGKYGSLVDIGDYKAMADEMYELLNENSEKRNQYLENTSEAIQRFDEKIIIKQIEKMLEEL